MLSMSLIWFSLLVVVLTFAGLRCVDYVSRQIKIKLLPAYLSWIIRQTSLAIIAVLLSGVILFAYIEAVKPIDIEVLTLENEMQPWPVVKVPSVFCGQISLTEYRGCPVKLEFILTPERDLIGTGTSVGILILNTKAGEQQLSDYCISISQPESKLLYSALHYIDIELTHNCKPWLSFNTESQHKNLHRLQKIAIKH